METSPIIAELDPLRNIIVRLLAGRVNGPVHQLHLQRSVQRFGQRIVEADAGAAHGLPDSQAFQGAGELGRGIITSAVRMEYRPFRQIRVPGRHRDSNGDERGLVVIVHRPPDYHAGRAVNDQGEVKPPFPGRDIRDVTDHFLAGLSRGEITVYQIGDRPGLALLGQRVPPRPGLAGHQVQLPHELADQLVADLLAAADQGRVHAPVPVFFPVGLEQRLDLDFQQLAPLRCGRFRPRPPVVVSGFRYSQPFAHLHDGGSVARCGLVGVLRVDELVFLGHRCSLAKYAAAFFRNAFSISRSRTRRSSSRTRSASGISDGSGCPASFFRYSLTQNPRVVSLTPISRATSAIVRGGVESTTFLAACSLNSGLYLFGFPDTRSRSFPERILLDTLSGKSWAPQCPGSGSGCAGRRRAAAGRSGPTTPHLTCGTTSGSCPARHPATS